MGEVIVELTSSFVMADLGIANHPRREHAAYIASWLSKWRARHFLSHDVRYCA